MHPSKHSQVTPGRVIEIVPLGILFFHLGPRQEGMWSKGESNYVLCMYRQSAFLSYIPSSYVPLQRTFIQEPQV